VGWYSEPEKAKVLVPSCVISSIVSDLVVSARCGNTGGVFYHFWLGCIYNYTAGGTPCFKSARVSSYRRTCIYLLILFWNLKTSKFCNVPYWYTLFTTEISGKDPSTADLPCNSTVDVSNVLYADVFFLHAALLKLYICVILDVKSNICWWTPWITKTYHNGSSKGYGSVCWTQMKKHVFTLGAESNSWCSSHFMNGTGNLVGIWMQLNNVEWSISRKYMDGKSLFQAPLNS